MTDQINVILRTEPITAWIRVLEKHMLTFSMRRIPTIDIFEIFICIHPTCIPHTHRHAHTKARVWPQLIIVCGLPITFK